MADSQGQLTGPDLSAGIEPSLLAETGTVLGHSHGEPVLLARVGEEYFAIGAICTHYGGPLADGLVVDETVRCPWHHACFSLRSGEALEAPALNPVACWHVARRDGRLFVDRKVERDPLAPVYPIEHRSAKVDRVLIVGAGAAGAAAAEMLRRCGFSGSVTIVDDDPDSPYDRPNLSKDYLAGNAPEEWIPIRRDGFYADHEITIVRGLATRIDVAVHRLEVAGRSPIAFDALILATGAEPVRLSTPGHDLPHVHYLRSLRDSRSLIQAAGSASRAVVIGASFIGLEVAASLRTRRSELDVHVIAPEQLPLERIMGRDLGVFIKSLHEERGVAFHLGQTVKAIGADVVMLSGGDRLSADLVVIGIGVKPRLQLAQDAGLRVDNGVVVNEYLETSAPGIYAAGDIARWPDPHYGAPIRVEHWVVAERQGQTAARNVLGARERYVEVPFFWSAHYDVSINYVGHAEKIDETDVKGSAKDRDVAVRILEGGRMRALATIFRAQESLEAEVAMERRVEGSRPRSSREHGDHSVRR